MDSSAVAASCKLTLGSQCFSGTIAVESVGVARDMRMKVIKTPQIATTRGWAFHFELDPSHAEAVKLFLRTKQLHSSAAASGVACMLSVSFLDGGENVLRTEHFEKVEVFDGNRQYGLVASLKWLERDSWLAGGTLLMRWHFEAYDTSYTASPVRLEPRPVAEVLASDLSRLLDAAVGADVELLDADDRCWHAHKCLLSARSDVFARMFAHDMRESQTNRLHIKDATGPTMACFLRFLYCGSTADVGTEQTTPWCELLMLAKKYEVTNLVDVCSSHLLRDLTHTNAAEALSLADALDLCELKRAVLAFVAGSSDVLRAVRQTAGFAALRKELVVEVMDAAVIATAPSRKRARESDDSEGSGIDAEGQQLLARFRDACRERNLHAAMALRGR